MSKKRPGFSTVVSFMSQEAQDQIAAESETATLPLAVLRPDPYQPRQLLTAALADALAQGTMAPYEVLRAWQDQAKVGDQAAVKSLEKLHQLANSIAQHGLINPVTVRYPRPEESVPDGVTHLVVTGERRYWAHVLLASEGHTIRAGEAERPADQVEVRLVAEGTSIRAHQLIENLMREDINALEKAHGLWALRYEISGITSPEEVEDGKLVTWTVVEESLSISRRYRIYLTNVLYLCQEAQALVQQHQLSERIIRPIVQEFRDDPAKQVEALTQLIRQQQVAEGQSLIEATQAVVDDIQGNVAPQDASSPAVNKIRRKVQGMLREFDRLQPDDWAAALQGGDAELEADLRALQAQLDALLTQFKH